MIQRYNRHKQVYFPVVITYYNVLFAPIFSKAEGEMKTSKKRYPGKFVEIPSEFERHVAGKGGDNLRTISTLTGAQVLPRGNNLYELRGSEKEVKKAELLLKRKVVCK